MDFFRFLKRVFSTELLSISIILGVVVAIIVNYQIVCIFGVHDPLERFAFSVILTIAEIICIYLCYSIVKAIRYFTKFISATYFLYKVEKSIIDTKTYDASVKEKTIKELFVNAPLWKTEMIFSEYPLLFDFIKFCKIHNIFSDIQETEDLFNLLTKKA